MIDLSEDWLGDNKGFSKKVFVQKAYDELKWARTCYWEEMKEKNGATIITFTGTPGVGKSHLAAVMVENFLIKGKVVYLELVYGGNNHLFYRLELATDGPSVQFTTHTYDATMELYTRDSKNAVVIVDGGFPLISLLADVEYLIFLSAQKDLLKLERKNPAAMVILYMPLFDLEE